MENTDVAALWRTSPDVQVVTDWRGQVQSANPAARRMGITSEAGLTRIDTQTGRTLVRLLRQARDGRRAAADITAVLPEGGVRIFNVQAYPMDPDRIAWLGRDVTGDRRREAALAQEVGRDPLTGLPDRIVWRDRLEHALARTRRSHKGIGLMYLDLDDFKQINDEFGHAFGDEVLREVARRIVGAVRPGDTVARVGGDEFVILCEDVPDVVVLEDLGDRISRSIGGSPIQASGITTALTCSVGVTFTDAATTDIETFIRATDLAMYEAKRAGVGTPRRGTLHPGEPNDGPSASTDEGVARVPLVTQAITERAGGALIGYAIDLGGEQDRSGFRIAQAIEERVEIARAVVWREFDEAMTLLNRQRGSRIMIRLPMSLVSDPAFVAALYERSSANGHPPEALLCCVSPRGARAERALMALAHAPIPVQLVLGGLGRFPVDLDVLAALHPVVCEIDSDLLARNPSAFLAARQLAASVGAHTQCAIAPEGVLPDVDWVRWLPGELLQPTPVRSIEH